MNIQNTIKYPIFLILILLPCNILYFNQSTNSSLTVFAKFLYIGMPFISILLFGKLILNKKYKQTFLSLVSKTFFFILINSIIIFINSGTLNNILLKFADLSAKSIELFWSFSHLFMFINLACVIVFSYKLLSRGLCYFSVFFQSYTSFFYFAYFIITYKNSVIYTTSNIAIFAEYLIAMSVAVFFSSFLRFIKK